MKLYEIVIKPVSGFGTPLKGDTLFGHFCWQAAYDPSLLNGGLDKWIECYQNEPFAVLSSAWPKFYRKGKFYYALRRPDLPLSFLFSSSADDKIKALKELKENKKRKWMIVDEDFSLALESAKYVADFELLEMAQNQVSGETERIMRGKAHREFYTEFMQQHNTINRLTSTTGEGMFAPFSETSFFYYPETELAIFALIDERATDIERFMEAFERIGRTGFGRDASTGYGQFGMGKWEEKHLPSNDSANACYALAPVVPEKDKFSDMYFTPFVRFGKHGDRLAKSGNPFKNPVVMADEGAVFMPKENDAFKKPFIGTAVLNTSKIEQHTVVHQGYAPYLPIRLEMKI